MLSGLEDGERRLENGDRKMETGGRRDSVIRDMPALVRGFYNPDIAILRIFRLLLFCNERFMGKAFVMPK